MATVEIKTAVDAAAFTAFYDIFQRYRDAFKDQPAAWEAVSNSAGQTRESFAQAADSMRQLADGMDAVLGRTRDLGRETKRAETTWQRLSRHTRDASSHIKDATGSLLKWAGITGLIAGVAGFGAEHLIFDFANTVSAKRSTALGLNTTYGGLASARVNYSRFGDADTVLGNLASAQNDPSKRLAFQNLGVSNFADRDTSDLLSEVLKKTKDKLDDPRVNQQGLAVFARNQHLDEIFSLSELQRIQHDSRDEVYGQADRIDKDREELDLAPDVQKKWQELSTQLGRAGKQIETVLVDRLVALEPGLKDLSKAFADAAKTLLAKDGPVAQWLDEIDDGLKWLAGKLGDPQAQKDLGNFVTQVGAAAEYVWGLGKKAVELVHWLAQLTGTDSMTPAPSNDNNASLKPLAEGAGINLGTGRGHGIMGARTAAHAAANAEIGSRSPNRAQFGYRGTPQKGNWWTDDRVRHAYDKLTAGGLSPREAEGQIARMAYVEAGGGPASVNPSSGAAGIYQGLGSRRPRSLDFDDQLDDIIREKGTTERKSHEAGIAAKDDFEAARAASMFERAEGYTQRRDGTDNFTAKTMAGIPAIHNIVTNRGAPPPAKVTINKNPGGNPSASIAAAAAPQ